MTNSTYEMNLKVWVNQVLTGARARLAKPGSWTRHTAARNAQGCVVTVDDPTACKWCVMGAVIAETKQLSRKSFTAELHYNAILDNAFDSLVVATGAKGEGLSGWNDQVAKDHQEVLDAFDKAIKGRPEQLESTKLAKKVLQFAKNLLRNEEHWTQSAIARDETGNPCWELNSVAERFSLTGAIWVGAHHITPKDSFIRADWSATEMVMMVLGLEDRSDVQKWNDDPKRTHREVVEVIQKAINL